MEDIDGDGRVLRMRIADADGAWMPHPDDQRLLIPVPAEGPPPGVARYRLFREGAVHDYDNFTIPTPRPPQSLDLNRNFPAGWGTGVQGSGDHPLSEPEIDALVRAIVARPNICGYNAFHTSGGVILRPSSIAADSTLPPGDVWTWKQLAARGTALTGYTSHSVFEDFTWDPSDTMSGAADDWAYEHLGVYSWTTEYWDVVHAATGRKQSTHFWYLGPTDEEALAVLRWCDEHHPTGHVDWYPFDHPQLGPVELGGWDDLNVWHNPPTDLLRAEVAPHAEFAVHQALCSPRLEVRHTSVDAARYRPVAGRGRPRQHRLAADRRQSEGPQGAPRQADRRRAHRRRGDRDRQARPAPGRSARRTCRDAVHAAPRRDARPGPRGVDRRRRCGHRRECRRQT